MNRTSLGGKVFRGVLWVAFGLFFLFPLYAMADFSTRNLLKGGRTLQAWKNLVQDDALYQAIVISLLLAVFTVVLMLAKRSICAAPRKPTSMRPPCNQ